MVLTTLSNQQFDPTSADSPLFNPKLKSPAKTRTLVLIDNYVYLTTHSLFFRDLGKKHRVNIKFASESAIANGNIKLSKDKVFLYDNVILMCTSL